MNTTKRSTKTTSLKAPARPGRWVMALTLVAGTAAWPAAAQVDPTEDLWILTESQQIFVMDTRTFALDPNPVDLGGFPAATCMTFSSTGDPVAFVTQGSLVRIVDVATRRPLSHAIDVAGLLGIPELDLTACAAAAPRTYSGPVFSVTRRDLFLGGTSPDGQARWIVLNQDEVVDNGTKVLVGSGRLHPGAQVVDVEVLDAPRGSAWQRAWYTLIGFAGGNELLINVPLELPRAAGAPAVVGSAETVQQPTAGLPRQGIGVGKAYDGKLPVQPGLVTGTLQNLDTGQSCVIPAAPGKISVHGPAPNSYSLFALDPLASELVVINPNDCTSVSYDVGSAPVALIPRREQTWDGLFVLNNGSNSLSFLDPSGFVSTFPLPSGPVDGGIAQTLPCVPDNLLLDKSGDDIVLSWDAPGCGDSAEFFAWCNCVDDAIECPCACDCSDPGVDPECACPIAVELIEFRGGVGDGFVLDYNPGDLPTQNPWKKLESTPGTTIDHEGVLGQGSWFYLINQSDEPPNP